ncbi:hypothetical protein [uncultured Mediterranean phage]|nr:hypothetical protein [uncultured Mediterranean phage]
MSVTITLQAASDSPMTTNGRIDGVALADDDLRKMYGLPNMYVTSTDNIEFVGKGNSSVETDLNTTNSSAYRWDIISPPDVEKVIIPAAGNTYIALGIHETHLNTINATTNSTVHQHRRPTTTAFQLRCDNLEHTIDDLSAISPMASFDNTTGSRFDSFTPGQLNNIVVSLGMRTETIRMSGFLMDEGICSPSNPRKQVIMNIARLQYLKSGRSGTFDKWGGPGGGPLNPRSYPCLTIFDTNIGTAGTFDSMPLQPSGNDLVYRGVITNLSFRQEGGRPNQWFWTMDFRVVNNEHDAAFLVGQGINYGLLNINRIRFVDANGSPITDFSSPPETGYIEVRTSEPLSVPSSNILTAAGTSIDGTDKRLMNGQTVFINSTDSNPSINGVYGIYDIDVDAKTFLLMDKKSTKYNEVTFSSTSTVSLSAFTAGTQGLIKAWSLNDGEANANFATRIHTESFPTIYDIVVDKDLQEDDLRGD